MDRKEWPIVGKAYAEINSTLEGLPDHALSAIMLVAAGILIWAAFSARPATKATLLAWVLLP